MAYASHRVVGVMELELPRTPVESDRIRTRDLWAASATAATLRKIRAELTDSASTPRLAFEPIVEFDSATLQRELEAELANLLTVAKARS